MEHNVEALTSTAEVTTHAYATIANKSFLRYCVEIGVDLL
jgi:hypothetical protein